MDPEVPENESVEALKADIAALQREIKALGRENALLRSARKMQDTGVWSWDVDSGDVKWSPEMYRIFGLSTETFQPDVDTVTACYLPEDRDVFKQALVAVRKNGRASFEARIVRPDGGVRTIALKAEGVFEDTVLIRVFGIAEDVSREIAAEQAHRRRESLFEKVFNILPVGLWITDETGRLLRGNPEGVRIWGAEPHVDPADYGIFTARRLPSGEEVAADDWALAHTIRDRVTVKDELLEIDAFDGKTKVILNYTAPVLDGRGELLGAVVVNRDITERHNAITALKQSEFMLHETGRLANIGGWEHDLKTHKAVWTDTLYDIIDYSGTPPGPDEHLDYYPDGCRKILEEAYERAIREGVFFDLELEVVTAAGKPMWCRVTGEPVFEDGQCVKMRGTFQDITGSKEAQIALERQKELLQAIVDHIPVMITMYDPDARALMVNRAFEATIGWTQEEISGIDILEKCYPDPNLRRTALKYMENASTEWREFPVATRSGETIDTIWSNVRMADGTLIGIGIDVTEKKRLEERLNHSRKMESIGILAGGVAHEFNNVLSIIIGNNEMALESTPESSPARHNLSQVREAGIRARDMVRQLLTFGRKDPGARRPLDIGRVVGDSLKLIRSSLPASIDIHRCIPEGLHTVNADATQMHQLMINLCGNAADAMKSREGSILISLDNVNTEGGGLSGHVTARLAPGAYVRIVVRDTGEGMSPETARRVFEPYFTTKEVGKGSGMGLAVVHGIVKQHGGAIFVESEQGNGTAFTVLLPAFAGPAEQPAAARADDTPTGDEAILFVDDEPLLAELGERQLSALGYRVTPLTDPVRALEMFRHAPEQFDLLITDRAMPKMTGDRLAENIHALRPGLPVILCSGYSEAISAENAAAAGISRFVLKPVERADLAALVREVLDHATKGD